MIVSEHDVACQMTEVQIDTKQRNMSSGVIKSSNGHSKINKFSMSWITMRFTLFASLNRIKTYNYYEDGLLGSGANVHIGWSIGWA